MPGRAPSPEVRRAAASGPKPGPLGSKAQINAARPGGPGRGSSDRHESESPPRCPAVARRPGFTGKLAARAVAASPAEPEAGPFKLNLKSRRGHGCYGRLGSEQPRPSNVGNKLAPAPTGKDKPPRLIRYRQHKHCAASGSCRSWRCVRHPFCGSLRSSLEFIPAGNAQIF